MIGLFQNYVEVRKNNVKVLILGPYRPQKGKKLEDNPCLSRLRNVRDDMRARGFKQTFLVVDFEDEVGVPLEVIREHFTAKSYFYIREWADICVFIFLRDCDNSGVEDELDYLVLKVRDKIPCSTIIHPEEIELSGLRVGKIRGLRIRQNPYNNDNEIEDFIYNSSFQILYALLIME